ncbi:unnamed protein product [Closterium sp. NIES-53]
MAAQELRWLTYLLTDLGEPPRSPPVLYVDNKAMLALCREQRLEHRTKHIALRYFLARELQQRGQLRLAYVASEANTADVFTKALAPCDHQRCCTQLGLLCFALLNWSCDPLFSPTLPMGVAPAGKGAVEKRGAPTPSGGAAGKGAGEKRGAPSQVAVTAGLLSKTKADSAAQLGIAGGPVEPVGKRPSSVLGDVSLSEPGSPPPGPRPRSPSASKKRQDVTKSTKRAAEATESSDIEMASTVIAARHEKSKKPKVIGYAPPPPPDDQGKTRGCKAPFKGPGLMSRKGKPVSEQAVGSRKRFLGTFETEADQKFCTAIC